MGSTNSRGAAGTASGKGSVIFSGLKTTFRHPWTMSALAATLFRHRTTVWTSSKRLISSSGGRHKAVQNWSRPSIAEIGVPKESWQHVHNKNQKRYNVHLVAGVGALAVSLFALGAQINFNPTPKYLKDVKFSTKTPKEIETLSVQQEEKADSPSEILEEVVEAVEVVTETVEEVVEIAKETLDVVKEAIEKTDEVVEEVTEIVKEVVSGSDNTEEAKEVNGSAMFQSVKAEEVIEPNVEAVQINVVTPNEDLVKEEMDLNTNISEPINEEVNKSK